MSQILIDDIHPYMFSMGNWYQELNWGGALNKTRSLTRDSGAYRTVRFIGTSITAHGGLQRLEGSAVPLKVQFAIDNGPRTTYTPQAPTWYYANATYYQSPPLPMGEHVLLIMNVVDNDILWLDYFDIYASSGGNPQLLQSDGSLTPSSPAQITTSPTDSLTSTTTQASAIIITSSVFDTIPQHTSTITIPAPSPLTSSLTSGSTSSLTSSSLTSATVNLTSTQMYTPMTTYQTTVIYTQDGFGGPGSRIPVIASATCGALVLFAIFSGILVYLCRRCRRQKHTKATVEPYTTVPWTQHSKHPSPEKSEILFEEQPRQPINPSTSLPHVRGSFVLDIRRHFLHSQSKRRNNVESVYDSNGLPIYAI